MIEYDVTVSTDAVTGRSIGRLSFEPRGWQVAYRHALREGLRRLGTLSTAVWNPAVDLCSSFRVRMTHAAQRTITATLTAA
ncbi:hypothetical protein CS0771_45180 [Catellatospora sp. IY07-71]|uniref:hypothetical protein n=1 Tax=Catellatospora sp. IY07-71 TaxID=2728827 RepID=UPI001BB378A5|nr:hypothetical protein [Catellatospora sp. IY07-71]BCJ74974.1 hypothetical protein CS0771_45180 [Catellatospora sp. IY07-71]